MKEMSSIVICDRGMPNQKPYLLIVKILHTSGITRDNLLGMLINCYEEFLVSPVTTCWECWLWRVSLYNIVLVWLWEIAQCKVLPPCAYYGKIRKANFTMWDFCTHVLLSFTLYFCLRCLPHMSFTLYFCLRMSSTHVLSVTLYVYTLCNCSWLVKYYKYVYSQSSSCLYIVEADLSRPSRSWHLEMWCENCHACS